jgi:hypothetical protein
LEITYPPLSHIFVTFAFPVSLNFNFAPAPFSLSRFVGAGLDKRTQKPLGAHQRRDSFVAVKENAAFLLSNQIMFPVWEI